MNVYFCDLCNESIPQADLDQGRAVRRNDRLICVACEAAMSSAPAAAAAAPARVAAPAHAPRAAPVASPSSVGVVALAFSAVALLAAAGSGAYLFLRFDGVAAELEERIAGEQRAAFERERRLVASVEGATSEGQSERRTLQDQQRALEVRVGDVEHDTGEIAGLRERTGRLEERVEAFELVPDAVERQASELATLSEAVAELGKPGGTAPATQAAPAETAPATKPSSAAASPAPPPTAAWKNWVGDLESQSTNTRWQAVQSLAATGDPAVVPHLLPRLKDSDIFVRMAAARTLGDLGAPEAIPALIDALEDEELGVRTAAVESLRALTDKDERELPFPAEARQADREKHVKAWRDWWAKASRELAGPEKKKGS